MHLNKLIRELDSLGVRNEVDMCIIIEGHENLAHDYQAALEWNNNHTIKIKKINGSLDTYITHYTNPLGKSRGALSHYTLSLSISITFSDDSYIYLTTANENIRFSYYRTGKEDEIYFHKYTPTETSDLCREGSHKIKELLKLVHHYYHQDIF